MKKLILGIMLITGSLSFSNESNSGRLDYFENLKLRKNQELENPKKIKLSKIFDNKESAKYQ